MEDGDTDFRQDTADDGSFSEGAGSTLRVEKAQISVSFEQKERQRERTHLAQREQDPLEEGRRLVDGLLERHVRMHAELVRLAPNLLADLLEQNLLVELLALLGVEVRSEDARRGVRCVRGPVFWVGEHEESRPHGERRENLEGFGEGSGLVAAEEVADSVKGSKWVSGKRERESLRTHLV